MDSFQGHSLVTITEFLRGMGGIQPEVVIPVGSRGAAGYQNQVKVLREDCEKWRKEGWCVALLSGGVARGKALDRSVIRAGNSCNFLGKPNGQPDILW